ncbi:MAG TPA: hypothetical protein VLD38_07905 [Nitrosopumilaceae archaeon]|nr:hypothetical protein [Nitrosopumilaceae archaeon]
MNEQNSAILNSKLDNFGESKVIGFSEQGKPLIVQFIGDTATLRIFILAGQHGDERYAKKAVNRLVSFISRHADKDFPLVQFAILSNSNPDGAFKRTRKNAMGIDLNRDHQLLESKEVRSLHSFVRQWRPHLIIDVHNYPSKRKHLLEKNRMLYHDVFFDIPSNPAIPITQDQDLIKSILKKVKTDLRNHNFSCERYVIITPSGRVRHSTPDVVDALNSFSLTSNAFTVLVEGRSPTKGEDKMERKHLLLAQRQAILSVIRWAQAQKNYLIRNQSYLPSKGDKIAIRSRYMTSDEPFQMTFRNTLTKNLDVISLQNYTPFIKVTNYSTVPSAYAIPFSKKKIIEVLHRHGFRSQISNGKKLETIQSYTILLVKHSRRENRYPRKISLLTSNIQKKLDDYEIFPTDQEGGGSLVVFLEPQSKYGLHRFTELDLPISPGIDYPVLRVL